MIIDHDILVLGTVYLGHRVGGGVCATIVRGSRSYSA